MDKPMKLAIGQDRAGFVTMIFPRSISYMTLNPDQARAIASRLKREADSIDAGKKIFQMPKLRR